MEQVLVHKDKALEFMNALRERKREAINRRALTGKDFISGNIEDARVWRDLDSFVRNHAQ